MLGKTIVCKFGGSSLANSTNIIGVKKIIDEHLSNKENRVIVVVSAPGVDKETMAGETKITDLLIELHNYYDSPSEFASVWNKIEARFLEIINSLGLEEQDVLAQVREEILKERDLDFTKSRGEYINALILSKYFKLPFVDARNNIIVSFENKVELEITRNHFSTIPHRNFIIPGFYGSCQGKIKCFSRGGSDITGSIVAIAVRARIYEKWTDGGNGLVYNYPTDMRSIYRIHYKDAIEMCKKSNVINPAALEIIEPFGIRVIVKNTFNPKFSGTKISDLMLFKEISVIFDGFDYVPNGFTNGEVRNEKDQNQGAAKVFSTAIMYRIDKERTLEMFCEYYDEVLDTPDGTSHPNIRAFMKTGFEGLKFDNDMLVLREKTEK